MNAAERNEYEKIIELLEAQVAELKARLAVAEKCQADNYIQLLYKGARP